VKEALQFDEAIDYFASKTSKPADWNSAEWAARRDEVRTKAFWSSRVENTRFLQRAHNLLDGFIARRSEVVINPDGVPGVALKTANRTAFVDRMRRFMIEEGMASKTEFASVNQKDVQDLRSMKRLELIFDTNVRQSYGYGQWKQGMTPAALRAFPAARLIRDRGVEEPRPRHQDNLGEVRLKTDPRWSQFHNAREIGGFEVPWGPYGFNSGVTQEDVSRREAKRLGLPVDQVAPVDASSTDGLAASVKRLDPELRRKLAEELRRGPKARDPKQAARDAAKDTRAEMLRRGLTSALSKGDTSKADRFRQALATVQDEQRLEVQEIITDTEHRLELLKRAAQEPAPPVTITPKAGKIERALRGGKIRPEIALRRLQRSGDYTDSEARSLLSYWTA